jgi:hypothetical protein
MRRRCAKNDPRRADSDAEPMIAFEEKLGPMPHEPEWPSADDFVKRASFARTQRGTLFYWLLKNYGWARKWLSRHDYPEHRKMSWEEFVKIAGDLGLKDARGQPPNLRTAQNIWTKVKRAKAVAAGNKPKQAPDRSRQAAERPVEDAELRAVAPAGRLFPAAEPIAANALEDFPLLELPKGVKPVKGGGSAVDDQ